VFNPNGISISSAIFALLETVTDRQTDRPTTLLNLWQQATFTESYSTCSLIMLASYTTVYTTSV